MSKEADRHYFNSMYRKRINRTRIALLGGRCEVTQTHRNGSDELAGKVELDDISDVRDLYYMLECVLREWRE
jgi:hypothetical protein